MLLNSKRRFKSLTIDGFYEQASAISNWEIKKDFADIIDHFGYHIKSATFKYINIANVVKLLNHMPNLEQIYFYRISDYNFKGNDFKLNLRKMREIRSSFCNEGVIDIFNSLPPDILQKIDITLHDTRHVSKAFHVAKLFESQRSIDDMEISEGFANLINFEEMKLKKLKLWGENELNRILINQRKITDLDLSFVQSGDFELICKELVSLKELRIGHAQNILSAEFLKLGRLKKLQKLALEFNGGDQEELNESIKFAVSESLSELELVFISPGISVTEATISQLGENIPEIKNFFLQSVSSLNLVNSIVTHMKSLEILHLTKSFQSPIGRYIVEDDLINDKLQELHLSGDLNDDIEDLPTLLRCCQNLKHLCLNIGHPRTRFFKLLKHFNKNLQHFECTCSIGEDGTGFHEIIYDEFREQFAKIEFYDIYPEYGRIGLVMSN